MQYLITGRVISDDDRGVLGLRVQIWDENRQRDVLVAETIAGEDGQFGVVVDGSTILGPDESRTFVNVAVLDRFGTEVYRTDETPTTLEHDPEVRIDIRVPGRVLRRHLAQPLEWRRTERGLVPECRWAEIRTALLRLGVAREHRGNLDMRGGQPERAEFRWSGLGDGELPRWVPPGGGLVETAGALGHRGICPAPDPFIVDILVDDAWQILDGIPDAVIRFADTLDVLTAAGVGAVAQSVDPNTSSDLSGPEVAARWTAADLRVELQRRTSIDRGLGHTPELLDEANATALLNAAAVVDRIGAGPYGRTLGQIKSSSKGQFVARSLEPPFPIPEPGRVSDVLGLMCAHQPLRQLHRAAFGSMGGDDAGLRHLDRIVALFEWRCGPDDGPIPDFGLPPKNCLEVLPDQLIACASELAETGLQIDLPRISDVKPPNACEGEIITIHGGDLGWATGRVLFNEVGERGFTLSGEIVSWNESRIEVRVPAGATCGIRVQTIREKRYACENILSFRPMSPTSREFEGGAPSVELFAIDGRTGDRVCVEPGSTVAATWGTCATNHVRVEILNSNNIVQVSADPAPASGSLIWPVPASNQTQEYTARITADGDCDPSPHVRTIDVLATMPATLNLEGVEFTQGIQRYSLADAGSPTNNSIPLIAGKDTVVRVFVSSDRGGFDGDISQITGFMRYGANVSEPKNVDATGNPTIDSKPSLDRALTDDSLNFLILAAEANGSGVVEIEVFATEECAGFTSLRFQREIRWVDTPAVPIIIRRIADPWTGNALSETEAMQVVMEAFDRLPSPPTNITLYQGTFDIQNISAEANYCHDGGFYQLALSVAYEHNGAEGLWPDPHESIWIGLYFQTGCNVGGMMSWPWTSTCISSRDTTTAAHEIAHCIGMGHTVTDAGEDCENIAQPVACHVLPNNALLDDVVFDIRNNTTVTGAHDLMSYQRTIRFPHPDHWEQLRNLITSRF